MLELVLPAGLRRPVVVREDEAALVDQGEELFEASNGPVAVQESPRHRPAIREREFAIRQRGGIDRAVVVFGGEQTIDLQKCTAAGRIRRFRPFLEHGQSHIGVVGKPDVAGHAGAYTELAHRIALQVQHRGGQTVEQVVQEHGPELCWPTVKHRVAWQELLGRHRIDLTNAVMARMGRKNAMAKHVEQHAFGTIGRDVTEAVVVVLAVLLAEFAEMIEEEAGEQPDDAEFQNEQLLFERLSLLGLLEAHEEHFRGVSRQHSIIVNHKRNWGRVAQKRLVATLTEVFLTQLPLQGVRQGHEVLNHVAASLRLRDDSLAERNRR